MKVLILTNMYPNKNQPVFGVFVQEQVESLRREGVDIDVLYINGKKTRLNYLWGLFRLWWQILTNRYDLIHAHYVFSGLIARLQFLLPVVLTHHGYEVFMTWERFPSRLITHLVDKVILVSREQKEKLKTNNAVVVPCGVDFELFKPTSLKEAREELGLPREKKLVLWAGDHTRPEKRYDIVQASVALVQQQDQDVEFVLVSDMPHEKVPLYMNACDVILLVSDGEGSPMVIKEAMACNLPVVSVPVGDVPDVIKNTEGCYLCRQDPTDVAAKLLLTLNPPRRTNGREGVKNLSLSSVSKRLIEQYQEVINRKRHLRISWLRDSKKQEQAVDEDKNCQVKYQKV